MQNIDPKARPSKDRPAPNQSPWPSQIFNDPFSRLNLLVGAPDSPVVGPDGIDLTLVDNLAGIQTIGREEQTPQGPNNDLMAMRSRFDNIPVLPLQGSVATVFLPTANTGDELVFPDGTTMAQFFGPADFYVSLHGKAEVPTAVNSPAGTTGTPSSVRSIYKPVGIWFYVGNIKSVGVVAPGANAIVQALCYITNQWPQRVKA